AMAQSPAERRAARQAEEQESKQATAPQYPDATRKDPGLRASTRLGPRLTKVSEAQQAGDLAAAMAAAEDILGNDKANAYERAITLRLLGDLHLESDTAKAQDYLRQALEADGLSNNEHFGTMLVIGQLQMQDEEYTQALATLDRLVAET